MLRELGATRGCSRLPEAELQGGPEIDPLQVHAFEQFNLTVVEGSDRSGQSSDPLEMPLLGAALLIDFAQALPAVLANRL